MSVVIKTTEMQYRDANGVYHGINAVAEKKIADQEAALDQIVANAQGAVNDLEIQSDTFVAAINQMLQTGTDPTLSRPNVAADAAACGDLKSALYESAELEDKEIHYTHSSGYYPMSTDEYMDIKTQFKKGTIINKIVIVNDSVSSLNELSISFWKQVGIKIVRYKTLTLTGTTSGMYHTFIVNEKLPYNTFISYEDPDILLTNIAPNKGLLTISPKTTEFNKDMIDLYSNTYQLIASIYYIENNSEGNEIVVRVGEGLDYEEIQDALEDTGEDNLTIILYPRNYPYSRFSMMRPLNQSYPWSGIQKVRNISIIGLDKEKCIVEDDSGNYNSTPAEIACNGIVKNITFIATHNNATYVSGDIPSYAVHIDNRPADPNGMNLVFEDCVFISHQCSAVGIGIYKNQTLTFKNCEFYNKTPHDFAPYANYPSMYNYLGAIIMHTSMGEEKGNDYFKLINNILITDNNRYSITLRETEAEPTCVLEMIGNTLWNSKQQNSEIKWEGPSAFIQAPYNRLNNNNDVNAD